MADTEPVCTMVREVVEAGDPYYIPAARDVIQDIQRLFAAGLAKGNLGDVVQSAFPQGWLLSAS